MGESLLDILESLPASEPLTDYERREMEKDFERVMELLRNGS